MATMDFLEATVSDFRINFQHRTQDYGTDCPWCARHHGRRVPETKKHVNWECPRWEGQRSKYRAALAERDFTWKVGEVPIDTLATEAFLCCGLPSEDPRLREEQAHLPEEHYEQEQAPLRGPGLKSIGRAGRMVGGGRAVRGYRA